MPTTVRSQQLLLVEDDVSVCHVLARHFASVGYGVTECADGETALAAARVARFSAVIADIHLPGMSGIEFAQQLLREMPTQSVLFITGDRDGPLSAEALALPVTAYLLKPFELAVLDEAVKQAVVRAELLSAVYAPQRAEREGVYLPTELLRRAEETLGARDGHGYRTALIARQVARRLAPDVPAERLEDLEMAARVLELGHVLAPLGDAMARADAVAELVRRRGASENVAELLRSTDVGARLSAFAPVLRRALRLADRLDQELGARMQAGIPMQAALRTTMAEMTPLLSAPELEALTDSLLLLFMLSGELAGAGHA